jgi:hypothetical protein
MATQAEISAIADVMKKVFGDLATLEASMQEIKVNTKQVTIDNQIAAIRKEIATFVDAKEAEIQTLLGMK